MRRLTTLLALGACIAFASPAEAQISYSAWRSVRAPRVRFVRPALRVARARPITRRSFRPQPAPAPEPAAPGQVACDVTENGAYGPAFVEVRHQGRVIASARCGTPLSVPAGDYFATLTLESAIDRPQVTVPLRVPEGGVGTARAAFQTSIIEVRFEKDGAPVYGQAVLMRDGRVLGSIGSRIPARVSAGALTIEARYRTERRTYELALAPEQRRALRARF